MPKFTVIFQCRAYMEARSTIEAATAYDAEEQADKIDKKELQALDWNLESMNDDDVEIIDVYEKKAHAPRILEAHEPAEPLTAIAKTQK